jgi:hypothetical protein
MNRHPSRRDLLKSAAVASAGIVFGANATDADAREAAADGATVDRFTGRTTTAASMAGVPFEPHETVRIAIVGTGLRGRSVLGE